MESGVIDSLLDKGKIENEIKSLIEGLESAKGSLRAFGETSNSTFTELANSIKKMKEAVNFTELTASIKEFTKAQKESEKVNKEYQTQQQKVDALTKQLIERNHELAVTEQKVRLQIAEKNREAKNEAQQQLSSTKSKLEDIKAMEGQAKSINEMRKQNRELAKIRGDLKTTDEQYAKKMGEINRIMDQNTDEIKKNVDSYTKWKMNIGNYQSALDGLKQQLLDASAALQKMAAQGDTQSEAYKEQQAALVSITAQIEEFKTEMLAAASDVEPMQTQLKKLKQEAQELYSAIKDGTATEAMAARFHEVTEEAADLQKKIQGVSARIEMLASNTAGIQAVIDGIGVVNAGFQVFQGVLVEAGIQTEGLQEIMNKMNAAYSVANGLLTLSNALKQKSALMTMLETAATSKNIIVQKIAIITQKALNAAQKSMPALAIIAALALLVGWMVKFAKSNSETAKGQKEFNEALEETTKATAEHASKIQIYINTMNNVNATVYQQQVAFQGLNKELENTGLRFSSFQESQEWYLKNGKAYNDMLNQQAAMQAHMNNHTKASVELEKLMNKRGARTSKEKKQIEELNKTIERSMNGISLWGQLYYSSMEKLGIKTKEEITIIQKVSDLRIATMKDGQAKELAVLESAQEKEKMEITGTAEQIAEQRKLIDQKYTIEREKINKKYRESAIDLERQLAGLRIEAMQDSYQKELLILIENEKKEKDVILNNAQLTEKQKGELTKAIADKYEKLYADQEKQYAKERTQVEIDTLNMVAEVSEKGSERRLSAQVSSLEKQREIEKAEAEKKGKELGASEEVIQANLAAIDAKYNKQRLDDFGDFIDEKIKKSQEEAEARARIAQEAAMAEEAAILEKYKNGEIDEKEYNKKVSDIRHKYSVQTLNDEISTIEKLLDLEGITAEQRIEIEKKIHDVKKSLSDEETSHEIENIKKVEEWRKKAAKMAQDLARQAFEMTMDFLIQQSEARIEEFDAELARIDELMDKELEWLDNAVMSDETRAAEEKRIKEQAKADSDKIEAEKRKEQQKQAAYQKAASIVQAIINTAQGITAALTIPVAGIALAAVVGALGAAQIAMIAAQPTPKYAKGIHGDKEHPGGPAIVGDARKHEYVLTPAGKLFETPAVPTLVDMEKGSQVFPDYKTMMQYFRPEIPKYTTSTTGQYEFNDMKKEIVSAIRSSKNVQQVQMNLDNNGIWYVSKNHSGRMRYINSRVNGNA
jgi:hypothetical protein